VQLLEDLPYGLRRMEAQPRAKAIDLLGTYLAAGWRPSQLRDHLQSSFNPYKPVYKPFGLLRSLLLKLPLVPPAPAVLDQRVCPDVGDVTGFAVVYARHCASCRRGLPGHLGSAVASAEPDPHAGLPLGVPPSARVRMILGGQVNSGAGAVGG
jgi:hypothetical protein